MWNKFISSSLITILLLTGLFVLARPKNEFSTLENRPLAQMISLSRDHWLDSSFQNNLEDVLADHFILRRFWIAQYNKLQIRLNKAGDELLSLFDKTSESASTPEIPEATDSEASLQNPDSSETPTEANVSEPTETTGEPGEFVDFLNLMPEDKPDENMSIKVSRLNTDVSLVTIDGVDQLVRTPLNLSADNLQGVQKNIQFINQFSKDISSGDVSAFFIETPRHSPLVYSSNNLSTMLPIFDQLEVPHDYFPVDSLSDVQRNYFHTDHHWNHIGSYQGYRALIQFLLGDEEPVYYPTKQVDFNDVQFLGSISRMIGHSTQVPPEPMSKLIFDLPAYEVLVEGSVLDEYGHLSYYEEGDANPDKGFDHYNFLYQKRESLITFQTHQNDRENVLFISDSMSNPIREVIAAHFNTSYFIDLEEMNVIDPYFKIEDFIENNEVDRIVFFLSFDNLMPDGEMKFAR